MADRAQRRAEDEVAELKAEAGGLASEAKAVAGDLRSAAIEQGRQLYEGAKLQATSYADERKNEAASSVSDIASSLRETGKGFGERPNIQAFVDNAADGLEQLASGLRERSFAELYGEAESYARRSPALVGVAAAAAGFLLARFIKSSADELSEASQAARAARASAASRASQAARAARSETEDAPRRARAKAEG